MNIAGQHRSGDSIRRIKLTNCPLLAPGAYVYPYLYAHFTTVTVMVVLPVGAVIVTQMAADEAPATPAVEIEGSR